MKETVDYLGRVGAFYRWMERNKISPSAVNLWHGLMFLWSQSGWAKEFTPTMTSLVSRTGLSKATIIKAREELARGGILELQNHGGTKIQYRILPIEEDEGRGE